MRNPADLAVEKKIESKSIFFSVWYGLREGEGKSFALSPSRIEQKLVLEGGEKAVDEYKQSSFYIPTTALWVSQ